MRDKSIASESAERKRYVGRSAGKPGPKYRGGPPQEAAAVLPLRPPPHQQAFVGSATKDGHPATRTQAPVLRWSARLVVVVALVGVLAAGLRLTGLFVPPTDSPSGVEATYGAAANVLAGRVGFGGESVRAFPLTPPWQGAAPADPGASLPLYTWLLGYGMKLFGVGEWLGRALSALFSLGAGLGLFALVRRAAGARAGLYALLVSALSPLSILLGSQLAPFTLLLLFQVSAMLALICWRQSLTPHREGGSSLLFGLALANGTLAALLGMSSLALIIPAAYLILVGAGGGAGLREAWRASPNRGKAVAYAGSLLGEVALWGFIKSAETGGLLLVEGDQSGGLGQMLSSLFNGSNYMALIGGISGKALTIVGLLLVGAGLLQGARRPVQWLFHYWLLGGLAIALLDSARLALHDDVMLPLLPPLFALAGIGAAWAGSLPARVWLALAETRRERDSDYAVSPHTAWLLDLPEERLHVAPARPQAKPALSRSLAQRSREVGTRVKRAGLMLAGHLAVLASIGVIGLSGWGVASARAVRSEASLITGNIGSDLSQLTRLDARVIVAGPNAAEIFFASRRTGWAVPEDGFSLPAVQQLQREGASHLISSDQEWIGRQSDYIGILTNYAVSKLTRDYILFDLNTKTAQSDRLYFLESGHTLGGEFRRFWETHGGIEKLGYPLSEELSERSPLDGEERKVQYFERAVLEYHLEFAGTPDAVMLASVGRWVTRGRTFQPVAPFQNTQDRVYLPQTGHSLKESFLRYWLSNGEARQFGYPISEELPEISSQDGKVYTVQYFERARFEWHPTEAGGPKEVQLGLIGKQAYELRP